LEGTLSPLPTLPPLATLLSLFNVHTLMEVTLLVAKQSTIQQAHLLMSMYHTELKEERYTIGINQCQLNFRLTVLTAKPIRVYEYSRLMFVVLTVICL